MDKVVGAGKQFQKKEGKKKYSASLAMVDIELEREDIHIIGVEKGEEQDSFDFKREE